MDEEEDYRPHTRELALAPASNMPSASAPCSPGLWRLLTEGSDGGSAIRLIALNKTLRAECERIAPQVVARASRFPNDDDQAKAILSVLLEKAPAYGLPARSEGEWKAVWDAYISTLWDLPPAAIEEAFARWKRNELYPKDIGRHAFYPKDNELYALAAPYWTTLRTAAWRARRALEKIQIEKPRMSAEERARNAEEIRRMMAQPQRRLPPQPPGITLADWAAKCRAEGIEDTTPDSHAYTGPRLTREQLADKIRRSAPQGEGPEIL